jgi:predicted lipoprotein with Yx(FWY)xxD motif
MKRMFIGLAAILFTASSALAVGRTADTSEGKAFVTDRGMTLYTLSRDPLNFSTCYGKCAKVWPPYKVAPGAKVKRGWTIITRRDGSHMWAYRGNPVYLFFKDKRPGDAYGAGISDRWGMWHVATVSGGGYGQKPVASYGRKTKASGSYGGMSSY